MAGAIAIVVAVGVAISMVVAVPHALEGEQDLTRA